jgi:serine/threonine protein kinase
MGDVYAAHDPRLARRVAVKLVRARAEDGPPDTDARMRLLREAQAIAKLSHPNVVVVHDVGTYRDNVFVAMEFVEGTTVTAWLLAEQRTSAAILALYAMAARGLEAAHRAGLVHRDFKPDNVMVGRDGQVRVMDFGLARQVLRVRDDQPRPAAGRDAPPAIDTLAAAQMDHAVSPQPLDVAATVRLSAPGAEEPAIAEPSLDDKLTRTGAVMGTPAYMAPEQFLGRATDARTDQFSFCVALYEALYGARPFFGNTVLALTTNVLAGIVSDPPPGTRVPATLRRVLLRGLALEPAARWPSMTALLDALAHDPASAPGDLPMQAATTGARAATAAKWILVGALAGSGVTAALLLGRHPSPSGPTEAPRAAEGRVAQGGAPTQREVAPSTLAAQVSLIDTARVAVASGDYDEAMRLIERYRSDFPDGTLAPDAEVVGLEAAAAKHDWAEVARRAQSFLARYRNDPHTARVEWLAHHARSSSR